jgi:nicotinamidase-related amidase
MQEPFLQAIHGRDGLTANVQLLVRSAVLLNIPVIATVQYVARMGGIVPPIGDALPVGYYPLDKMSFSCAGDPKFEQALKQTGRRQLVLCGVETHICVSQTAHDLKNSGFEVHVAADAVSSRTLERHKLGMERIRDAGIKPCAAESAVYEWLVQAGTPEFKEILKFAR